MDKINELLNSVDTLFSNIDTLEKLNNIKVEYLGKKGKITELNSMIKDLQNEEKKEFGIKLNELKSAFNNKYEETKNKLDEELINKKLERERIDITLQSKKRITSSNDKNPKRI